MKNFLLKIRIFFFYLFRGLIAGDAIIKNNKNCDVIPDGGIEEKQEQQSVINDLLKGEITEEVKELRHEMYYSERKSHEYVYCGGGNVKKNSMFDYNGSAEKSDGNPIKLVQMTHQIVRGMSDDAISTNKSLNNFKIPISDGREEYSIKIERNFCPRFLIERYTVKLVVKEVKEKNGKALLDFYVPNDKQQFNNITKLFQSELDRIYMGDKKSDLVIFDKVSFTTKNCFGSPDLFYYEYKNPIFSDIIKFDGHYVLRFYCDVSVNGFDTLSDIYHAPTAEKNEKHEARDGASINFFDIKTEQENISTVIDEEKNI